MAKHFTIEFKQQAVRLYETTPGATISQIAADLGIGKSTLSVWLSKHGTPVHERVSATISEESSDPDERVKALEKENHLLRADKHKLETERDILRQAAKYFAGETIW